jgi:replicative DNA helicase
MNAPMDDPMLRALPMSRESEQAVIGALLLDNSVFDLVGERLRAEHFFAAWNREVFAEVARQLGAGKPADVLTVFCGLQAAGSEVTLEELNALAQWVPSAANLVRYAEMVLECAHGRALLAASEEIGSLARDQSRPIAERVEQAQALLSGLLACDARDDWVSSADGMHAHLQTLQERFDGRMESWATGLKGLDGFLEGGLRPGSLAVIGARPGHGKTALGMTIGLHMAAEFSVALMSMEMPHRDVRDRMTAMLGQVGLPRVLRPNHGDGLAWDRVLQGAETARGLNFFVTDQAGLNINQLRLNARSLKRRHGLHVLIVDYIGLMSGLDSRQSRAYQIEEITKGLKSLAKEIDIAVLALAQLNRQIEQRTKRRPMLSDFRDSGSIEQDADIVLGLYREAMDKPDLIGEWLPYAELSVLKNRQGRSAGTVPLYYVGEQTRFTDWKGPPPSRMSVMSRDGFE